MEPGKRPDLQSNKRNGNKIMSSMKPQQFSVTNRLKSFRHALNGLRLLLREEHNARIHLIIAIGVVAIGCILKLSASEWMILVLAIGGVITTEIINTVLENIADFISPEKHTMIKKIKDLAAAGVLVSSITALVVGVFIFLPKFIELC